MEKFTIPGLCPAKKGTLCQCGQCAHLIRVTARRMGKTPDQVIDLLNVKVVEPTPVRAPRRVRTLGPVAARASVVLPGGVRVDGQEAVLAMAHAMGLKTE